MLKPTNARNITTFLTIITFNQLQSQPLVYTASSLPPSWAVLQRNSTFQTTPGSNSGSTSACLWPWSEGTLLAYWFVCKLDLILATLSALTSDSCPSLASLQWIAIAFRMSMFSVSFIVFSMFFYMFSVKPLCSIVLLPFSAFLTNPILKKKSFIT